MHDIDHWELFEGGYKYAMGNCTVQSGALVYMRQDSSLSIPTNPYYRMRQAIYRARGRL